MNGSVDATATGKTGVGGRDDGVTVHERYVGFDPEEVHGQLLDVFKSIGSLNRARRKYCIHNRDHHPTKLTYQLFVIFRKYRTRVFPSEDRIVSIRISSSEIRALTGCILHCLYSADASAFGSGDTTSSQSFILCIMAPLGRIP